MTLVSVAFSYKHLEVYSCTSFPRHLNGVLFKYRSNFTFVFIYDIIYNSFLGADFAET